MAGQSGTWYPTIFPDKCNGCEGLETPRCIELCPNDVFEIKNGKAVVARSQNCVDGCIACESVCSKKAITFPQYVTSMPRAGIVLLLSTKFWKNLRSLASSI